MLPSRRDMYGPAIPFYILVFPMEKAIMLSRLARDYLPALSHTRVTRPLDLFDLAGSYIDLKRAVIPDGTFRVFQRNSVVT